MAVVGVGVMGANLARNFARHGQRVALFDRRPEVPREIAARHPDAGFVACASVAELVAACARPRRIVLMVPAGEPVDASLDALAPLLGPDDIVVDAGNSHFADTDRRCTRAEAAPWRLLGMGVSGGSEGALHGPAIMPGGDPEAWEALRPALEAIAAVADTGPCVAYCGRSSAGHFVKMVHNGIEYGDMQLIAESAVLLRDGLGMEPDAVADTFARWNDAELESYLVAITADIFRVRDPQRPGALLLDAVLDRAGQKGTGRWTVQAALDHGVAIPTIAAAVDARALSADKALRVAAGDAFARTAERRVDGIGPDDVRAALYAAKITGYGQGFDLLACASRERGYGTDLAEVARIWKAGCIIRAGFLDRVREAFAPDGGDAPGDRTMVLAPGFRAALAERVPSWRRVVAGAARAGLPVPGLAASLAWFDTLTTAHGSANLIQAQRDTFGHHTYERTDAPGTFVHTDWSAAARRVEGE